MNPAPGCTEDRRQAREIGNMHEAECPSGGFRGFAQFVLVCSAIPLAGSLGCGTPPAPDEAALERYYAANALFDEGRFAEAVPHYEFAISARDRLKDAYHRLAYCHEVLGDEARAVQVFEKARRVDRQDAYALRALARLYAHRGRTAEAVDALKALLAADPGNTAVRDEIGRLEVLRDTR